MTFFDPNRMDKLSNDQRAQYQEFLKAYPHLQNKMETSRQLNTPLVQAVQRGEVQGQQMPPPDDDAPDLAAIDREQRADDYLRDPSKAKPIAAMNIDSKRASMQSLEQEDKQKEQRMRERLRRQREEEAREDAAERLADDGQEPDAPRPPKASAAAPESKKKPPKFSPVGKRHPVLQKMRQSLGMEEMEKPVSITIQGVKYTMRRLMREDIGHAISLGTARSTDEATLRTLMETAIVAYSVREIDDTPLYDVFDVPFRQMKLSSGQEEPLSTKEREEKGAHFMFGFLVDSPTELTDTLVVFYEQNFPPVSLTDGSTSLALCPVSNCSYKSIVNNDQTRFCPHHGKELRKEGSLPNPS